VSESTAAPASGKVKAWEEKLLGVRFQDAASLIPGLFVAVLLAALSIWLSDFIGLTLMGLDKSPVSAGMMAILLGLIVNNVVPLPGLLTPGFTFAVKKVLRLGIILLGIRLSIFDVFELGALGVPLVIVCISSALVFTTLLNRRLGLPERLGTLIAVGTSICGVSAIVATGPAIDAEEEEVTYAVAVITVFGMIATLTYPYLAHTLFAGHPTEAGLFLGTAVHDTSQVTGAALVFAETFSLPRALDVATVTKLVRNVFMAAVIPLMTLIYTRRNARRRGLPEKRTRIVDLLPLFVIGFLVFAGIRSLGDAGVNGGGAAFGLLSPNAWAGLYGSVKAWAVRLLVVALAGVGLNTSLDVLRGLGIKPFLVGLGAAVAVGVVSFGAITAAAAFLPL
jgi:uncharacterized integral membrane protein (TIGR00698 family)